jgi:hypothetical protein
MPIGCILQWYGASNAVPIGWGICNGASYIRSDGSGSITSPNLIDKVIVCAGNTYAQNSVGGNLTQTPVVANTTLTIAQIPSHNHGYSDPGHAHGVSDPWHAHGTPNYLTGSGGQPWGAGGTSIGDGSGTFNSGTGLAIFGAGCNITIANNGGGGSHGHTGSPMSIVQPYIALHHIIKI